MALFSQFPLRWCRLAFYLMCCSLPLLAGSAALWLQIERQHRTLSERAIDSIQPHVELIFAQTDHLARLLLPELGQNCGLLSERLRIQILATPVVREALVGFDDRLVCSSLQGTIDREIPSHLMVPGPKGYRIQQTHLVPGTEARPDDPAMVLKYRMGRQSLMLVVDARQLTAALIHPYLHSAMTIDGWVLGEEGNVIDRQAFTRQPIEFVASRQSLRYDYELQVGMEPGSQRNLFMEQAGPILGLMGLTGILTSIMVVYLGKRRSPAALAS